MRMHAILWRRAGLGRRHAFTLLAAMVAGLGAAPALAQGGQAPATQGQATLPGGAQSLNEVFEDWQVSCAAVQGGRRCAASQQQADAKTRQRVLVVELQPKGTGAEGVLIMPFGLALDKGVTLKAGDAELGSTLRYSTCLPQGCIVPLALDAKALGLVRKAQTLTVGAVATGGQATALPVSLKGFTAAFDRAAVLLK